MAIFNYAGDPYRNPINTLVTGGPGAPSASMASGGNGKGNDEYSSWGQYNYSQMSGQSSDAAAYNHSRGYGGAASASSQGQSHQGE